jgi:hypothetical protein
VDGLLSVGRSGLRCPDLGESAAGQLAEDVDEQLSYPAEELDGEGADAVEQGKNQAAGDHGADQAGFEQLSWCHGG